MTGKFERGDLVKCYDSNNVVVAQGLCNYNSTDCSHILRCHSKDIIEILGYCNAKELIHCDNLLLL